VAQIGRNAQGDREAVAAPGDQMAARMACDPRLHLRGKQAERLAHPFGNGLEGRIGSGGRREGAMHGSLSQWGIPRPTTTSLFPTPSLPRFRWSGIIAPRTHILRRLKCPQIDSLASHAGFRLW